MPYTNSSIKLQRRAVVSCAVSPERRMEDHIRKLTQRIIEAKEASDKLRGEIAKLRAAIAKHIENLRIPCDQR